MLLTLEDVKLSDARIASSLRAQLSPAPSLKEKWEGSLLDAVGRGVAFWALVSYRRYINGGAVGR